jgi:hypothetical protein
LESEHYYPEEQQSVIKLGSEAESPSETLREQLVADELQKIEVVKQILGNVLSEDIPRWSERIGTCLPESGGSMRFWSIIEVTRLAPVEVLLGLLLGSGLLMKREITKSDRNFYGCDGLSIQQICSALQYEG